MRTGLDDPLQKVAAFKGGEWIDDFTHMEDVELFVENASEYRSIASLPVVCGLARYKDDHSEPVPALEFAVLSRDEYAMVMWEGDLGFSGPPVSSRREAPVAVTDAPHSSRLVRPDDLAVRSADLLATVRQYVVTGRRPDVILWRSDMNHP